MGTLTEIYDYLRLLYGKIGKTYSPISGNIVQQQEVSDVVDFIKTLPPNSKLQILAPLKEIDKKKLENLLQDGIQRLWINNEVVPIETLI